MFRRSVLTAAVAVAALATPAASQAAFVVTIAGTSGPVSGSVLTMTEIPNGGSGIFITAAGPGSTAGGATGASNPAGTIQTISTPAIPNAQTTPANATGLLGGVAPAGGPVGIAAGVFVGATFQQAALTGSASQSATSNLFVFNNTTSTTTITITLQGDYTAPGGNGTPLLVTQRVSTTVFGDQTGATGSAATNPIDTVASTATGTGTGGGNTNGATTATLTTATVPDGTQNQFVFTRGATGFQLSQTFTITLGAGQTVQFQGQLDATTVAAPAPGGLILAAAGAPFLGLLRRRFRSVEPTAAA